MEIASLILMGLIALIWQDSLRAKETGIKAVRQVCAEEGLQLLDETISLFSLKPARDDSGRLVLRRVYQFEFSENGENRRRGSVHLLGRQVVLINTGLRLVPNERTLH